MSNGNQMVFSAVGCMVLGNSVGAGGAGGYSGRDGGLLGTEFARAGDGAAGAGAGRLG